MQDESECGCHRLKSSHGSPELLLYAVHVSHISFRGCDGLLSVIGRQLHPLLCKLPKVNYTTAWFCDTLILAQADGLL